MGEFKFNLDTLPPEVLEKVRPDVVKFHAPILAKFGINHGSKMIKAKLSAEEKFLSAFYAVAIASEEGRYSKVPELTGLCVYGFASMGLYDLAMTMITRSIDPDAGGTSDLCIVLLVNLSWLNTLAQKRGIEELSQFVEGARTAVTLQLRDRASELYEIGALLKRRERSLIIWSVGLLISKAVIVVIAAFATAQLLIDAGIHF